MSSSSCVEILLKFGESIVLDAEMIDLIVKYLLCS